MRWFIKNNTGPFVFPDIEKKKTWKYYYERWLNGENTWEEGSLNKVDSTGHRIPVDNCMVDTAVKDMRIAMAIGLSRIAAEEMHKMPGRVDYRANPLQEGVILA